VQKLLVANRGEIAVRVLRAASELDIRTVAIYSHEDRASFHRLKADEAYAVGGSGHPLRSYLDIPRILALALDVGADALHPGYGLLSERADLAHACADAGITFVGPAPEVLHLTGDKLRARAAAERAGLPVLRASPTIDSAADAARAVADIGYPVFVKATGGGGGRGLRRVDDEAGLAGAVETAMREAEAAFGDPTIFLEEAMVRPRHIEVQLLGDHTGEIVHLYERDCSVQRRHQKVIEVAPAPNLDVEVRSRLLADAVRFGEAVGYTNAGTVEFLLDGDGRHAFIEMNPRIQVEHTVTEEVTDVDIVQTQLLLAAGARLADLGIEQDRIVLRGTAVQCRITTEDPSNGFRPDLGRISAVRDVGGAGIRVDSASVEVGMEILPYFDPLLVKLTARGADLRMAARRARRAVTEFRVRGVRSNAPFLAAVLADEQFLSGGITTAFLDERPDLLQQHDGGDRTTRLLAYLADATVNRVHGDAVSSVVPRDKLPVIDETRPPPPGSRQRLERLGPDGFAADLRAQEALGLTDTTFRDAHQSLLATRLRTFDLATVGPTIARTLPGLFSVETWGGATYDTAIRFLKEDPWDRLEQLRAAIPNVCFQMLLRGKNVVGYGTYPLRVVELFVKEAVAAGIDIFRIFDALNNVDRMEPALRAVVDAGKVAEGTLCYTADLLDPSETVYTLDHYLGTAEQLIAAGAHVLCIKDMAGLLRPRAASRLVTALRERFDAPVHLHTHDTAGGQLATYLAAADAGVDVVDGAAGPLSGGSSQPSLAAIVAATERTERRPAVELDPLIELEPYWEAVRRVYAPFEAGLPAPTGRVYRHEIPGGQLSNLRQQAAAMGLGDRFEEIEDLYERCDHLLGRLIKVTPTSKVVGDLALFLLSGGIDPADLAADPARYDLPTSVVDLLSGDLGVPPGGWPEPLRTRLLAAHGHEATPASDNMDLSALEAATPGARRRRELDRILFPQPTRELETHEEAFGDVSVIPTPAFLHGLRSSREVTADLDVGVRLYIELEAITDADERGRRTVVLRVNGQTRLIEALDRSLGEVAPAAERADPGTPGHVSAPVTGVVTVGVEPGQRVEVGDRLASIEAMKMESPVTAPMASTVDRVAVSSGSSVEAGDLLLVLRED
jgi:pyruvate carboxylase